MPRFELLLLLLRTVAPTHPAPSTRLVSATILSTFTDVLANVILPATLEVSTIIIPTLWGRKASLGESLLATWAAGQLALVWCPLFL